MYIEKVLDLLSSAPKKWGKNKSVAFIILVSVFLRWKKSVAVLQILETWLSKERLLSNSKPRFLTRVQITINDFMIQTLNGTQIERVVFYKYLGIWLDDKLTYSSHIDSIEIETNARFLF